MYYGSGDGLYVILLLIVMGLSMAAQGGVQRWLYIYWVVLG